MSGELYIHCYQMLFIFIYKTWMIAMVSANQPLIEKLILLFIDGRSREGNEIAPCFNL